MLLWFLRLSIPLPALRAAWTRCHHARACLCVSVSLARSLTGAQTRALISLSCNRQQLSSSFCWYSASTLVFTAASQQPSPLRFLGAHGGTLAYMPLFAGWQSWLPVVSLCFSLIRHASQERSRAALVVFSGGLELRLLGRLSESNELSLAGSHYSTDTEGGLRAESIFFSS